VANLPERQGLLVYDLRQDPSEYLKQKAEKLAELWQYNRETKTTPLPVKTLRFNRCPAIAPLGVLDAETQKRLNIDLPTIKNNLAKLKSDTSFGQRLLEATDMLNAKRIEQVSLIADECLVDSQLYDGFIDNTDRKYLEKIRQCQPDGLAGLSTELKDERLQKLVPLYKARNYPRSLSDEERTSWEEYRKKVLLGGGEQSRLTKFSKRLMELGNQPRVTDEQRYLLEELRLYAESILPDF
jgi:exodeoxyribonuclease-1